MAQDPGPDTAKGGEDASSDLDMVTLFSSSNVDAEMEANNIHGLLQASGIPSIVVGATMIPSLEFQVQAPRTYAEEAERLIEEARAAGPDAADEAEEASEHGQ